MAEIQTELREQALVISVKGPLTSREIISVIDRVYPSLESPFIIWDLTDSSISSISVQEFQQIAQAAKRAMNPKRKSGKTAYVSREDLTFGMTCMYTAYASLADVPIAYSVFRTMTEALEWLAVE